MTRLRFLRRIALWLERHAAADRNSVTITVAPAQAERTFQIELPRWSLRLLGVILVASFVLVLAGGILYGRLIRDAIVLREVKQENQILRARAARLEEIEKDIAQLERVRRQLYAIAGVKEAEAVSSDGYVAVEADGDLPHAGAESAEEGVASDTSMVGGVDPSDNKASPLLAMPIRGPLSRGFNIAGGRSPEHAGVDVAGREGTQVVAAGNGMVIFAGRDETFGNMLVIRHEDGWETTYGHNTRLLVGQGDSVLAGQAIALLGSTGKSSAPHLHFEVHHDGEAVDPGVYFPHYRSRL